MSQRLEFVNAVVHRAAGVSLRSIFAQFGMSERTGHKWTARFVTGGPAALADRSHAPHVPAHQLPREITEPLVALREAEPKMMCGRPTSKGSSDWEAVRIAIR